MGGPPLAFYVFLLAFSLSIAMVKRERIIVPMIAAMCFLPADIPITIASLNFYPIRILALVAIGRLYLGVGSKKYKLNTVDILFLSYNIVGSIIYIIASLNFTGALVFRSGVFVDSVIVYFVFRNIIQSKETILIGIKTFGVCVVLLMPFTLYEYYSASNLFSIIGRDSISIRNGEVRAKATFSHAILYGSFAAAIAPLLWARWKAERNILYLVAVLGCLFIVIASGSSGPIVVLAGVIFFTIFFRWKQHGKKLAWFSLFTALTIHFVRESPIWHFLYVRITIKASSTGWHRYILTDAAVKEFPHWWLLGYGDVGPQWHTLYWPRNHARFTDVTNHYLLEGVRGGLITMLLFIALCYVSVKTLGGLSLKENNVNDQLLWWAVMVMMLAHCLSFLSVAYFGQITMLLFLTFAIASYAYDLNKINRNVG